MRFVIRLIVILFVVVGLAVGAVALLPADRLGKLLADQLTGQIGRTVTLEGARVSVWPEIGLRVEGLQIANADWASGGPMLAADRAAVGLDALAALGGTVVVRTAQIESPVLRLEQSSRGAANWDMAAETGGAGGGTGGGTAPDGADGGLPPLAVNRLSITDATVIYRTPDAETVIENADLELRLPDPQGPLDAILRLEQNGGTVSLNLAVADPAAALAGAETALSATIETGGGTIGFDGSASSAPALDGTLALAVSDTAALAQAFGVPGVAVPAGLGRSIRGDVVLSVSPDMAISAETTALSLDQNTIGLSASVDLSGKPRIDAVLRAAALDLGGLAGSGTGGGNGGAAPSEGATGWDTTPIDASALGLFDGRVAFSAASVDLGDLTLAGVDTVLTVDNSRAVLNIAQLGVFGGQTNGEVVVNNRSGLSMRAGLSVAGLALREALASAGIDRIEGPVDARIDVLGSGPHMAAIMASLSGSGSVSAGPGLITGIDLAAAFGGDPTGGTTVFNTAAGSFTIDGGVLRNDDLAMDLPVLEAGGAGAVDLGRQSIDYTLSVGDPTARDGRGLVLPVRLRGPWSDVGISVDASALLESNLDQEVDALRDRSRSAVEDAVTDRLGVTRDEGESAEDAVRRQIEDRAREGILNLFNR